MLKLSGAVTDFLWRSYSLADPTLFFFDHSGALTAANDNWSHPTGANSGDGIGPPE